MNEPPRVHCKAIAELIGGSLINSTAYKALSQLHSAQIAESDEVQSPSKARTPTTQEEDEFLEAELSRELENVQREQIIRELRLHPGESAADAAVNAALKELGLDSLMDVTSSSGVNAPSANLADILNPNHRAYNVRFSNAYHAYKSALDEVIAVEKKKKDVMVTKWSSISIDDHAWYLSEHTLRKDTERTANSVKFTKLQQDVFRERKLYMEEMKKTVMPYVLHYLDHCTDRQGAQIFDDLEKRRSLQLSNLGRYWKLKTRIPLPSKTNVDKKEIKFRAVEVEVGSPLQYTAPPAGTFVPGDKRYLPADSDVDGGYRKAPSEPLKAIGSITVEASALIAILSTSITDNKAAWEVLVDVDEKGCLLLHKPLIPRETTTRALQTKLSKYAALTLGDTQSGKARQVLYSQFELGEQEFVVRSHASIETPLSADAAILAIKTEYLPDELTLEMYSPSELAHWYYKLLFCPVAHAVHVIHVHVPKSKILHTEMFSKEQLISLMEDCMVAGDAKFLLNQGVCLLDALLSIVRGLPKGSYILSHGASEHGSVGLFENVKGEETKKAAEMPCGSAAARENKVYDLHMAHEQSGRATASLSEAFFPPRWQPYKPDVPQIPYTFPPRVGRPQHQVGKKSRQKRVLPYSWGVLGHGGDFDKVEPQVAKISRKEYEEALEEQM